jgi:hypothetical protein
MKKTTPKVLPRKNDDMRPAYDFSKRKGGVRGKYYKAMQQGYSITIHKADGTQEIRRVPPRPDAVILALDVCAYFPDSDAVNEALRCLIPLVSKSRKTKRKSKQVA